MKVAIYLRVSKDDGKMDPENQRQELLSFISRSGWELYGEYEDRQTGTNDKRPAFNRLFADASKRKFDMVLFWDICRFSREGARAVHNHIGDLEQYGVGWRSYTEPWIDSSSPLKDIFISMSATFAKMEQQKISERTKAGLKRARRQGKILGRPRVKVTAYQIRSMQAEGKTLRTIANDLDVSLSSIMRTLRAA